MIAVCVAGQPRTPTSLQLHPLISLANAARPPPAHGQLRNGVVANLVDSLPQLVLLLFGETLILVVAQVANARTECLSP